MASSKRDEPIDLSDMTIILSYTLEADASDMLGPEGHEALAASFEMLSTLGSVNLNSMTARKNGEEGDAEDDDIEEEEVVEIEEGEDSKGESSTVVDTKKEEKK